VHEGLFGVDTDGSPFLIGGRCEPCGRVQFPMAPTCPACGSDAIVEAHLSAHGTLWGWTADTAPPPGALGPVPFGFGVVELPEGLRVITRLEEADPSRLEFGMPMRLVVTELGSDPDADDDAVVTTYSFTAAVASPGTPS
jgi:uncharacterized OB-fold protein